ncbi:MAG: TadE/TadG family type IV pilus assembly protein [Acidimicrobiales bacterium]
MASRRLHGDRGAVLVEAAFVLPVMLFLAMAVLEFGYLQLRQSQLSSASRDGARTGIITWVDADKGSYSGGTCPSSPTAFTGICTSVLKRLTGAPVSGITVACYDGSTTTVKACRDGTVVEGIDTMGVTVTYGYKPVTFVGQLFLDSNKAYTSSTRMVIQ